MSAEINSAGGANRSGFPSGGLRLGIVVAAGIPLAMLALIHFPPFGNWVLRFLLGTLEKRTQWSVTTEAFDWHPFSRLVLHNAVVRTQESEIIRCEQAELRYHLSLGRPFVRIQEVSLVRPLIHLEKDARGRWRLPGEVEHHRARAKGEALPSSNRRLPFSRLQVSVSSGTILGRQESGDFLRIRDVSGSILLQLEDENSKLRIGVDLPLWPSSSHGRDGFLSFFSSDGAFRAPYL